MKCVNCVTNLQNVTDYSIFVFCRARPAVTDPAPCHRAAAAFRVKYIKIVQEGKSENPLNV